jgi:hypothetical protein
MLDFSSGELGSALASLVIPKAARITNHHSLIRQS